MHNGYCARAKFGSAFRIRKVRASRSERSEVELPRTAPVYPGRRSRQRHRRGAMTGTRPYRTTMTDLSISQRCKRCTFTHTPCDAWQLQLSSRGLHRTLVVAPPEICTIHAIPPPQSAHCALHKGYECPAQGRRLFISHPAPRKRGTDERLHSTSVFYRHSVREHHRRRHHGVGGHEGV